MEEVDYVTINKLTEGGESPGQSEKAGLEAGFVLAGIQTFGIQEHHHTNPEEAGQEMEEVANVTSDNNKLAEGGESPREIEMTP